MNPPGFLAKAGERYFEPSEEPETGFLYGRFNPPGEHHVALVDYVADKYDLDEVYVATVDSKNTSRNPMATEQVIEALDISFEEIDIDYDLNLRSYELEDFKDMIWDSEDVLDEGAVYYTGDLDEALAFDMKRKCFGMNFDIDYEHRKNRDIDGAADLTISGTQIKELISEGDQKWREYVSLGAEQIIDENPEIVQRIQEGDPSRFGKHWDILLSNF